MSKKPLITATTHILPFTSLGPTDFERLCLWLVESEGTASAFRNRLASTKGCDGVQSL
jgi:hypothetical protein